MRPLTSMTSLCTVGWRNQNHQAPPSARSVTARNERTIFFLRLFPWLLLSVIISLLLLTVLRSSLSLPLPAAHERDAVVGESRRHRALQLGYRLGVIGQRFE